MRVKLAILILFFLAPTLCAQTNFDSLAKAAATARESGHTEEAIANYKAALAIHPDWQEGWWYIGTLNYDANHYAEAIPPLQKLLELNPGLGAAWNFLALCEFETKDYAHSLDHLQKGFALDTRDDPEISRVSQYHLALLLIRDSQFENTNQLLSTLEKAQTSESIKFAMGLAALHVPLLPTEIDPSREALIRAVGEAVSLFHRGEFDQSLVAFQKLANQYPEIPFLKSAYADALYAAAQNNEAAGQKQKAAEENALAQKFSTEKPADAKTILLLYANTSGANPSSASNATPVTQDQLWNQAMESYAKANFRNALSDLKIWTQSKPDFGTAWAVMGLCEFELKDYDNAQIHLERGQQLGVIGSPSSVRNAKVHLAMLFNREHQFDAALRILSSETIPDPCSAETQFVLGLALLHMPQFPDQVPPTSARLVQSAGEIAILLEQSKYSEALPKLQSLIKENPSAPFLHYAYGTALASLSEYDSAWEQFLLESQLSPASELPQIRIASLALRTHQPENALSPAQRAVQLAPSSGEAHYILGRTYLELGKNQDAIKELETASTLTPGSPEIHFNLAKAYAKAKLTDKAAEERATFVRLNELAEKQHGLQANQSTGGRYDSQP